MPAGALPRPAGADAVRAALRRAAAHGPFFAVGTGFAGTDGREGAGEPGAGAVDRSGWRPLAVLTGPEAGALRGLVEVFAARLGVEREPRVAASVLFQTLASRLWSPLLACAAAGGPLPHLAPERTSWRYRPGEPVGLRVREPAGWEVPAGVPEARRAELLAGLAARLVVDTHLRPLLAAHRGVVPVAAGLLWGNAASALAGTLEMLERGGAATPAVRALTARLLDVPPLRGTGTLTADPGAGPVAFRRRSCCLYYRVPGGGLCGDCALAGVPR